MTNAKSNKEDIIQIVSMVMIESLSETAHILMVINTLYNSTREKGQQNKCLVKCNF